VPVSYTNTPTHRHIGNFVLKPHERALVALMKGEGAAPAAPPSSRPCIMYGYKIVCKSLSVCVVCML